MDQNELKEILGLHEKWLRNEDGGVRADLRGADLGRANLRGANLQEADLRGANLQEANLRGADLRGADLGRANLQEADLRGANLRGANLRGANLRGADFDFSCFPLWCGSLGMKCDERLVAQLAYHIYRLDFEDTTGLKDKIKYMAEKFHRFGECGGFKE